MQTVEFAIEVDFLNLRIYKLKIDFNLHISSIANLRLI